MVVGRIVAQIFGKRREAAVGRSLVELVAQSLAVEAVQTQETRPLGKRTARILRGEVFEIGLCGIVILEIVVAEAPVVIHGVILFAAIGKHGQGLEKIRRLIELALVEIVESRCILCIDVVAVQQCLILGFAGCGGEDERCTENQS